MVSERRMRMEKDFDKVFKKWIIAVVIIWIALSVVIFCGLIAAKYAIKEAGGVKQIAIDAGKEIKDIKEKINEE